MILITSTKMRQMSKMNIYFYTILFYHLTLVHLAPINTYSSSSSSSSLSSPGLSTLPLSTSSSDKSVLLATSSSLASVISSMNNNNNHTAAIVNNHHQINHNKPMLSFPPMHCLKDSDCIGKNTSSKIFYDPNARCDIRQNSCVCRDAKRFKRVQIRVNVKQPGTTGSGSSTNTITGQKYSSATINSANNVKNNHPENNHQLSTIIYVSKCMLQDSTNNNNNNHNSGGGIEEIVSVVLTRPHYYGQPCTDDRQCSVNMICRQLIITSKSANSNKNSTNSAAANLAEKLTANRTKRCRCPIGQHWNKYIRRCEWINSNSLFQFGLALPPQSNDHHYYHDHQQSYSAGSNFAGNNAINGGSLGGSSSSQNTGGPIHSIAPSNIDLKIFEIVLEIAFLVACLLGYKACSSICCKETDKNESGVQGTCNSDGSGDERDSSTFTTGGHHRGDNGRELKSDEESILSSSVLKSSILPVNGTKNGRNSMPNLMTSIKGSIDGRNYGVKSHSFKNYKQPNSVKTARRMSRKRRMSRLCAAARRNSSSPFGGLSSSTGYYNQNFRRLSSVSASAMSRSSSASTRNLLVKINPTDANKCLSVLTVLAPQNNSSNNNGNDTPGTGAATSPNRTLSPCYNCRIYKEVYSPSAKCKSCRSLLLSVATSTGDLSNDQMKKGSNSNSQSLIDFDSLMLMVNGNNTNNPNGSTDRISSASSIDCPTPNNQRQSLSLALTNSQNNQNNSKTSIIMPPSPSYKQKPIRRSEEVGVPPHLRAPYRDSQPFWLK